MQDNVTSPQDAPTLATPSTTPANAATNAQMAATLETTSHAQPAIPQTRREFHLHPLWLALVVAALFGLIFGVGAIAANANSATPSAPSGTEIEQMTINVIQQVDPSVVQVVGRRGNLGFGGGTGSGEILTTSGYIVTNDHVVHGLPILSVVLSTGQEVPAQLVGEAPTEDLAVLKINPSNLNLKPIVVGDSSQVQVGEYAIAMGSPIGLVQSATSGIISALNRQVNEIVDGQRIIISGLIQTSAPINPGNSGGALVNLRGQLIGIPTFGAVEPSSGVAANGIGFAITSNRMKTIVNQLTNGTVNLS
jgi:S1-C subfamily serine protease